jgi:hypothetical protein
MMNAMNAMNARNAMNAKRLQASGYRLQVLQGLREMTP